MTTEFGPLKGSDVDQSGLSWRLSGKAIAAFTNGLYSLGLPIKYDPPKNRFSLHGDSERSGSELRAGFVMAMVPLLTLLTLITIGMVLLMVQSFAVGTMLLTPLSALVVVWGLVSLPVLNGLPDRAASATVFDHTTPETDTADLDAVKQEFLNGEIDEAEFDRRVDKLIEAETEARLE